MKKYIFLAVLFFFLIGSVQAQIATTDYLKETYRKGFVSNNKDTLFYQKEFFKAFPSNFKSFKNLYGWDEKTNLGRPLTNLSLYYFKWFFRTKCVSPKILIKKIIDVSINGVLDADAIARFQQDAFLYAINNNKAFIDVLKGYSAHDVITVWAFYFDYENLAYRKIAYNKIVKLIAPNDKGMITLITAGYKKASARWENH
jgi:hypothetical protein